MRTILVLVAALSLGASTIAHAQVGIGPAAIDRPPPVPAPVDHAFAGTISLHVDATDSTHHVFAVHETIPVQAPGEIVLFYPEWEIGSHAPTASVAELAGLVIHADGKRVEWRRDPIDVHAFHVDLPPGAGTLVIDFQFLASAASALLRPDMVDVQWHRLLLYPAGWYVRDIPVAARLTLPAGLHAFTALSQAAATGDGIDYRTTSLERLVDSPVYAGRNWRRLDLTPGSQRPVAMDILADRPADLAVAPDEITRMRVLVEQTLKAFGPAPFPHYDAIVTLSDVLSPGGGIEHGAEGENNLPAAYFTDLAHQLNNRDLIAHELVHAWNGRATTPADLWSPTFNEPVQGSLLWVYEGQTEFWGRVLTARAALRTRQQTLDKLALDAAVVANRHGRAWKSLADSTNDAVYMAGHSVAWRDWQRREDYYPEGVLLWLNVEARLRELSNGKRGLDDFARLFFAAATHAGETRTYTFEDVCSTLNAVVPNDWSSFLAQLLASHDDADAIAGLARAGWRLAYSAVPSETYLQDAADSGADNLDYSIGLQVREDGTVRSVAWDGPAFRAGLSAGSRILAVGGKPFSLSALEAGIAASMTRALVLGIQANGGTKSIQIPYRGPLRYPRLVRIEDRPDRLSPLLVAR